MAPKFSANVLKAWKDLGFSVVIDSQVEFSGMFDAKTRTIILQKYEVGNVIYHEIGHFLSFIAGNICNSSIFKEIYGEEKAISLIDDARVEKYRKVYAGIWK